MNVVLKVPILYDSFMILSQHLFCCCEKTYFKRVCTTRCIPFFRLWTNLLGKWSERRKGGRSRACQHSAHTTGPHSTSLTVMKDSLCACGFKSAGVGRVEASGGGVKFCLLAPPCSSSSPPYLSNPPWRERSGGKKKA